MTRFWLVLCVVLSAQTALAQQKTPAELQATILKLEREVVDLFQKRKTDALQQLLADDFIEVTSEGRRGKAAVFKELDAARDEPLDETVIDFREAKLNLVTPDTALLTYRLTIQDAPAKPAKADPQPAKAAQKGKQGAKGQAEPPATEEGEAMAQYISSLWVKRDGRWLNVFYQSTPAGEGEE